MAKQTERDHLIRNRRSYMTLGDPEKLRDRPNCPAECGCPDCEAWRKARGRPTHAELRLIEEKVEKRRKRGR